MFFYIPFCRESNADQDYLYILGFLLFHQRNILILVNPKNPKNRALRTCLTVFSLLQGYLKIDFKKKISFKFF